MTKTMTFAALSALLLSAAPALAAPGDVLTVDLDRVLSESAAAKNGTTQRTCQDEPEIKFTAACQKPTHQGNRFTGNRNPCIFEENAAKHRPVAIVMRDVLDRFQGNQFHGTQTP